MEFFCYKPYNFSAHASRVTILGVGRWLGISCRHGLMRSIETGDVGSIRAGCEATWVSRFAPRVAELRYILMVWGVMMIGARDQFVASDRRPGVTSRHVSSFSSAVHGPLAGSLHWARGRAASARAGRDGIRTASGCHASPIQPTQ